MLSKIVEAIKNLGRDERGIFKPETVNIFVLAIFVVGIAVLVYTVAHS